jgi:hypothetical protein
MTVILKDLRRQDDNRTLWNPYWITSSEINYDDVDGTDVALITSFPAAKYGNSIILVQQVAVQIVTLFSGGTPSLDVGLWTIATDDITVGGTITVVDADEYVKSADVTEATAGIYWSATADFLAVRAAVTNAAPVLITPADGTVPCIAISGAASGAAGVARVLMQVIEVPTY